MKVKLSVFLKWFLHYVFAGVVSVTALFVARDYMKTKFELLVSEVPKDSYEEVVKFLEDEYVPYIVSFDHKRIRVPDYELPRLRERMKEEFNSDVTTNISRGGY